MEKTRAARQITVHTQSILQYFGVNYTVLCRAMESKDMPAKEKVKLLRNACSVHQVNVWVIPY